MPNDTPMLAGDFLAYGPNSENGNGEEDIFLPCGDFVTVASGTTLTITGTDGTMTADNTGPTPVNTINWNAGGSEIQTIGVVGNQVVEDDQGFAGSNGTGTQLYDQQIVTSLDTNLVTDTISGQGAVTALNGATVTLDDGASAKLVGYPKPGGSDSASGSGNTVIVGSNDSLTIKGGTSNTVAVSGDNSAVSDDSASSGNSFTLNGSGDTITLSDSGDSVVISGTGDTITVGGSSDTLNITGSGTTVIAASGAALTTDTLNFHGQSIAGGYSIGDTDQFGRTYSLNGTTLTISTSTDTLTVNNFQNGDFGLYLGTHGYAYSDIPFPVSEGSINDGGEIVGNFNGDRLFIDNNGAISIIPVPGGVYSIGGISNNGMIALNGGGASNYIYDNGTFTPVSISAGPGFPVLTDINDSGEIVGYAVQLNGGDGNVISGFLDNNGTMSSVQVPGSTQTFVTGINDKGVMVGFYQNGNSISGFVDNGGVFTTIVVPSSIYTHVNGINNNGVIIGNYATADGRVHGFTDNAGVFTTIDNPNGTSTNLTGINDSGEVVGKANTLFTAIPIPAVSISDTGTVYTLNNDNVDIAPGAQTTINGANDFINVGNDSTTDIAATGSTLMTDTVSFNSYGEQITLSNGDVFTLRSVQAAIVAADGTLIANNNANGDGVIASTVNWNTGGSEVQTFTVASDDSYTEDAKGYSGSTGSGTFLYEQITHVPTTGPVTATISGTGDVTALNNTTITLADATSVSLSGNNNVIIVSGATDTVNISQSSTLAGDMESFNIRGSELISFNNGDEMVVSSGVSMTIIGSDGTMIVNDNANGDGVIQNIVDFIAGGSEVEKLSGLAAGVKEVDLNYSGADGTGTLLSKVVDLASGTSKQVLLTSLPAGVGRETLFYSSANLTGTLTKAITDFTAGNSSVEVFNPSANVLGNTKNYSGLDGTGTLNSQVLDLTDGTSKEIIYTGLPTGVSQETLFYSGADLTGSLTKTIMDFTAGNSTVEVFNPSSTVLSNIKNYSGLDGSGTLNSQVLDLTDGTSKEILYTGLPTGVSQETLFYSGADLTGSLTKEITDFTAGNSTVEVFSPNANVLSNTRSYTGLDGSGTNTMNVINYTAGGSQEQLFTGLPTGESEEDVNYSGANLTGTLTSTNFIGTSGNDTLTTTATKQTLTGNGGYDTYQFGTGDGQDTIKNGLSTNTGPTGELDLGSGIATNQVWFEQKGNNLQIDLMGTTDHITIVGWYSNTYSQLQEIKTADGSMIDSQLQQLVQAMATYSAAHHGFNPSTATQVPNDPTLQSMLAAAWHH